MLSVSIGVVDIKNFKFIFWVQFKKNRVLTLHLYLIVIKNYENIISETFGNVGIIKLNRPKAMNALNNQLIEDLNKALFSFENEPKIGCIIITGEGRAFAAGADVKEMATMSFSDIISKQKKFNSIDQINHITKPLIAAVNGYALGGGLELALACDILIASRSAMFGQPEIKLGIIPGFGATQRLPMAIGKSRAMEIILTGDMIDANVAERYGIVSRIFNDEELMEQALKLANKIASHSHPAVAAAKMSIKRAFELGLENGIKEERNTFYSMFSTEDQKEGMKAFIEKREPKWRHK